MDILFCNNLSMKQGVFILAIQFLNRQGQKATWGKVGDLMGMTSPTIRKIGHSLAQKGILEINLKEDELGGSLPTELTLNEEILKLYTIKGTSC